MELRFDSAKPARVIRRAASLHWASLTGENTVSVYARYGIDLLKLDRVSFDDGQ